MSIIIPFKEVAYTDKNRYDEVGGEWIMRLTNTKAEKFLYSIFVFTEEEDAAMHRQIPMTKMIYRSCMDKFMKYSQLPEQMYIDFVSTFSKETKEYFDEFISKAK